MRYEDIIRHYKEGKPVLRARKSLVCFLILFFIFTVKITAQINLNGFCNLEITRAVPGMGKLHLVEINKDGNPDLILTNPANREIAEMLSTDSSYNAPVNRYIYHPVTDIKLFDTVNSQPNYLLISRYDKACTQISFNKNGRIKQIRDFKFNTMPGVLEVGEVTGDSLYEAFICGDSFDGITEILRDSTNKLVTRSIISNKLFSDLKIADLDYDGLPDLAAVDFLKNEIKIFVNEGYGNFTEIRSIELTEVTKHILLKDVNKDGFTDLILSVPSGLIYSSGDSVSTFSDFIKIETLYEPDKFLSADFNNDGLCDFAYLDKPGSQLHILFNEKTKFSEWQPDSTIYTDMLSENNNLILLTKKGNIKKYSTVDLSKNYFTISLSDSYTSLHQIHIGNMNNSDLAFFDSKNSELKILQSTNKQMFHLLYQYPLSSRFTNIFIEEENRWIKEFYFFTPGKKLIELIKINFELGTAKKEQLYSYYPIHDLKVLKNPESGLNDINILAGNNLYTGFVKFFHRGIRYRIGNLDTLINDETKSKFLLNDPLKAAFIQKKADTSIISTINFSDQTNNNLNVIRKDTSGNFTFTYLSDKFSTDDVFLYKNKEELKQITSWTEREIDIRDKKDNSNKLNSADKFFKIPFKGNSRGLYKIEDDTLPDKLVVAKIIESEKINDYFVTGFTGKYFLTYTLNNSNLIYFYELK